MIAVRDRRDAWVGPSSRPEYGLRASLGWWSKSNSFSESEMALFYECMLKCAQKDAGHRRHCQRGDVTPIRKARQFALLRSVALSEGTKAILMFFLRSSSPDWLPFMNNHITQ